MIATRGTYVATPAKAKILQRSVRAYDRYSNKLVFALAKGAVPPALASTVPTSCLKNCNRMDAAGPADGVSGSSSLRSRDGRIRSRAVKSHTIGYNLSGAVSAWTRDHADSARAMGPLFTRMLAVYKKAAPKAYAIQNRTCAQRFMGLPFSSAALNCNLRTGLHKDRNDLPGTMGVMTVVGDDRVKGFELVLPEYGIAVDVRVGDVLVFDSQLWHANARARNEGFDRRSLVVYAR